MGTRLEFHSLLTEVLGSTNVYFQPPSTIQMRYPCIVYELSGKNVRYADNGNYLLTNRYTLTVIDRNPDTLIPDKIQELRRCKLNRVFTANNLNHYVFDIYY